MVNGAGIDAVSQWVGNYKQRIEVNIRGRTLAEHNAIDLFRLYILFSQYKSCDNTQEDWSFVLLIKKSACRHIHPCMRSF